MKKAIVLMCGAALALTTWAKEPQCGEKKDAPRQRSEFRCEQAPGPQFEGCCCGCGCKCRGAQRGKFQPQMKRPGKVRRGEFQPQMKRRGPGEGQPQMRRPGKVRRGQRGPEPELPPPEAE